jgi:rare lipoprotein A
MRSTTALGLGVAALALASLAIDPPADARHVRRHARTEVGVASYYGPRLAGKVTASGKRFSPHKLTAASPTLPLGTKAKVTNQENGRAVAVRVTRPRAVHEASHP